MGNQTRTRKQMTPQEQAYVNVVQAADWMTYSTNALLKAHGLSGPQYNVLRILRGVGEAGLPCRKIAERLISHVPDITRLLDRLEKAGSVMRDRGTGADRRVVITRITPNGLERVNALDRPIERLHREQLSKLTDDEIQILNDLFEKLDLK